MERVAALAPDAYAGNAQLRTLQRRIRQWRAARAKELILGTLGRSATDRGITDAAPSRSTHEETAI